MNPAVAPEVEVEPLLPDRRARQHERSEGAVELRADGVLGDPAPGLKLTVLPTGSSAQDVNAEEGSHCQSRASMGRSSDIVRRQPRAADAPDVTRGRA